MAIEEEGIANVFLARAGKSIRLCGAGASALVLLAACGGGGGGTNSTPRPAPAPTPAPAPAPSPSPSPTPAPSPSSNFDTAEYRRSDGPAFHGAVNAWRDGSTGLGQTIAVIDTGIDSDSPEFAGRIHPDSRDVAANRGFEALDDHGTHVAMIAAAARNDTGIVGIAFNSTILALRADAPGSCTGASTPDATNDCGFADIDIAAGIDQAIASGAAVINISLGGGTPFSELTAAVARAAQADVVVVVSAGNDGDGGNADIPPDQPDPFASGLVDAGNGNVIIVGSVDAQGVISGFSNKAGTYANSYIAALGEDVCCIYDNGELLVEQRPGGSFVTVFSGTSFSAPQVSGAVALLSQAFPNLTARQIVQLLIESARDAGATGADPIYGSGILDIANAFAPKGVTSLAGSASAIPLGDDTGIGSAAMGDAMNRGALSAVVLDKYRRAYTYGLGARLRGAQVDPKLHAAVGTSARRVSAGTAGLAMAFTLNAQGQAGGYGWSRALRLTSEDAQQAEVLAGRIAMRLSPDTDLAIGIAESAQGLGAQLRGADRPAFMLAGTSDAERGFRSNSDVSMALRQRIGAFGLTMSAEQGDAWLGSWRRADDSRRLGTDSYRFRAIGAGLDRTIGPVAATIGLTWLDEDRTILGSYFHEAFGADGAQTLFLDASTTARLGDGWSIGADLRRGYTRARHGDIIAKGSDLQSMAWSLDLARGSVLQRGDSLGLRFSQPLRVERGGLMLNLPVAYDYATETSRYGLQGLSLTPEGRELTGELAWRGSLWGGGAAASLFYRRQPGHYAAAPDDAGVAIKWSSEF